MDEGLAHADVPSCVCFLVSELDDILKALINHEESIKIMLLALKHDQLPAAPHPTDIILHHEAYHILLHIVVKPHMHGHQCDPLPQPILLTLQGFLIGDREGNGVILHTVAEDQERKQMVVVAVGVRV